LEVNNLFTFFAALVISMAIIPLAIRWAPRLGMVDYPDARKVHASPIPRAGGVGIVLGTLIPILLWAPSDPAVHAYLFGSLVLLVFGMWDDAKSLGYRIKFLGQIIAAAVVVYYGNVYIETMPFMDVVKLPAYFAKPFTVFAIIGMINALNASDGLDGLAGGLSILSLGCIAYLASQVEGDIALVIVLATLGGAVGFLRYNTYPARVFMGDGGSQFLGFTLGFLAVLLTQKVNTALSPVLPLLFLGLPIIDILTAMAQRLYYHISPFVASKHHLHHRLLELGFDHYEAVVIIYSVHTLFVASAILLRYEQDWLIMSLYLGTCTVLLFSLFIALHKGWQAHQSRATSNLTQVINALKNHRIFRMAPIGYVKVAIPVFMVAVGFLADKLPSDFGALSVVLLLIALWHLLFYAGNDSMVLHTVHYVTVAFVVYLQTINFDGGKPVLDTIATVYFVILAVAVGLVIRYGKENKFKTTPMDYLVILIVVLAGILLHSVPNVAAIGLMAVKLIIVFYGCEIIITHSKGRWSMLNISSLLTLSALAIRGML
jgi:UDP-GlcNAc:undecaprenyl-phosphate GlcNAc-1-phosphate transferase